MATTTTGFDLKSSEGMGLHYGGNKATWLEKQESEPKASFLRAIRNGNLEMVVEMINTEAVDINTSNQNGLNGLHLATKEGHVDIVSELIMKGADVDAPTRKGNASLHIACLAGYIDIVQVLISNGAKINIQSKTGFSPLYMAAQENHVEVVKYLLDHGASQSLATEDGFTALSVALQQGHNRVVTVLMENDSHNKIRLPALHVAAKKDDAKAATLLLQNEHNVSQTTKSGFTPLHIAAHYGSQNVAKILIDSGAEIDCPARNAITPLHVASKWGRSKLVSVLINHDANMECITRDSLTPLHCATRSGHSTVVEVLLRRGAFISSRTKNGLTPLHMAAQGDHIECANVLLCYKAPIDDVTMDYLTPLHIAAHCGNLKIAKYLLDQKCEVSPRALNGFTPLHVACKKNRIKIIELLLRYSASIESSTESGLTALHVASFMGHIRVVNYLLENGAKTEVPTVRGETALHLAARSNQNEVLQILLRHGAQVDARAKEGQTPLHISSRLGNVDGVRLLLEHGASRDLTTKDMYTPLHIAVKEDHLEVAQLLLDNGAQHNTFTKKGFTPLHISAKYDNVRLTKLLLAKGADPNVEGKNGLTPLHVATHYNHIDVARVLLDNKASSLAAAKNGYTSLHIAAKKNEVDIAKVLMENGAKSNLESKNGYTPLHLASQMGHVQIVDLLLEHGADANCRSKNGLTPMHLTAQEDHVPVARILVKHGSEKDSQTNAGYTPLHTACHFGQLNMIQFLLEYGASVNATTKLGYTPLHQAAQQGHVLVINLLLKCKASPNVVTTTGHTALSIAHQLGYISVVEILKHVTEVSVPVTDEKYKVVFPETMQEVPIDSDEDGAGGGGDFTLSSDRSYQYLTLNDSKEMRYGSLSPTNKFGEQELFAFETRSGYYSTLSSLAGRDPLHDELRYMQDDSGSTIYRTLTPSESGAEYIKRSSSQLNDSISARTQGQIEDEMKSIWTWKEEGEADLQKKSTRNEPHNLYLSNEVSKAVDTTGSRDASVDAVIQKYVTKSDNLKPGELVHHFVSGNASQFMSGSRLFGSPYSETSLASSFNPDNVSIDRQPVYSGFLVSFIVDARGGAMRGCRHSGVRIIIPPGKTCMPVRVTCRLLRKEKLSNPPTLMDGEALAARILEMGPTGAKFTGPVLIEIPHFASLKGKDREIVILRSDNGFSWQEHILPVTEDDIQKALGGSFEDIESAEDLYKRRITRILTTSFPQYFAIVTRIRHETKSVGTDGGIISSTVVPQVQAMFPPGSITKTIRVALQVLPVDDATDIERTFGENVSFSPIVAVEPRHRKFHQPITVSIPLPPKSSLRNLKMKRENQTLRLLCSITGGSSIVEWEDITGSNPLTLINDCVSFSTNISARFWLMDCQNAKDSVKMATQLYNKIIAVPFLVKFVAFAKRRSLIETRLRIFCMTDDKMDKTLENQQHFVEIARSKDVEVLKDKPQFVELIGNLIHVIQSSDPLFLDFHPFRENRLQLSVRMRDIKADPSGQIVFFQTPRSVQSRTPPVCVLNIVVPKEISDEMTPEHEFDESQLIESFTNATAVPSDKISKGELKLTDIADNLQSDWVPLARQLGLSQSEIIIIQKDYRYVSEQALVVLHLWLEKNKGVATGNELERALLRINRVDIIDKCMRNVEEITDDHEKQTALSHIEKGHTTSETNENQEIKEFLQP